MPTKCEGCEKYYESEWLEPICRAYGIILSASYKEKPYCHLFDDAEPEQKRTQKKTAFRL